MSKEELPVKSVQARVKTNNGFKPIGAQKTNRNVGLIANRQLALLKAFPERIEYIKESLKEYLLIKKNVYLNRKRKVPTEEDIYKCECISSLHATREDWDNPDISIDCGEGCLNRQMSLECEIKSCPCGITCQNRRFQLHHDACVYPKGMAGKGFGLVAGEKIKKGQFVIQYIGEVLSLTSEEGTRRINEYARSTCTYMMKLNSNEVIDPTYKGNMARFINHSCDPNCESQKWNVLGEIAVGIFAVKDIEEGEELSFNYQFDVYLTPFTRCLCGTTACKGYLGLVPLGYTAEEWNERVDTMPCEICGSNDEDEDDMFLICDNCNNGYHTFCLKPPLTKIPEGAWFCERCKEKANEKRTEEIEQESENDVALKRVILRTKRTKHKKAVITPEGIVVEKRGPGRPRKKNSEDLAEYNEIYNLQKELQREIIQKLHEHSKEIDIPDEDEEEEEEDPEEDVIAEGKISPNKTQEKIKEEQKQRSDKKEKKSRLGELKLEVFEQFQKILQKSTLFSRLEDQTYLEKVRRDPMQKRRMMTISTIELVIFQEYVFRKAKKLNVKLFWDRSFHKRDFFTKANEFRLACNDEQYEWFRELFELLDQATHEYKMINNFTRAVIKIPAIFLKRTLGEYHKNVHHIQAQFNVNLQYDKNYFSDECYPLHVESTLTFTGIKENILQAIEYLQHILNELKVKRIYMSSSDIRVIISNLMPIKQQIHPSEIRCCRDNALRDINHPFYTIYYSDKEVAFVGTESELEKSITLVEIEIAREKQIKKNVFSLNYLVPVCEKYQLLEIKQRIESVYENTKLIIYNPTLPRKNISLTLCSNYINFDKAYADLKDGIDAAGLYDDDFETIQKQTIYQMIKYFFKYLQNYFQTKSTIFMKSWDTTTTEFCSSASLRPPPCFQEILSYYIKDHEFKFYILSVTRLCLSGGFTSLGLTPRNVTTICKFTLNRSVYTTPSLHSKNYQSIFSFSSSDFTTFLEYYNPQGYFSHYSGEKISEMEHRIRSAVGGADCSRERSREKSRHLRETGRARDPDQHSCEKEKEANVIVGYKGEEKRREHRADPRSHRESIVDPRSHKEHRTDPRSHRESRVDPRGHKEHRTDPRSHRESRVDPRGHKEHRTDPRTQQTDIRDPRGYREHQVDPRGPRLDPRDRGRDPAENGGDHQQPFSRRRREMNIERRSNSSKNSIPSSKGSRHHYKPHRAHRESRRPYNRYPSRGRPIRAQRISSSRSSTSSNSSSSIATKITIVSRSSSGDPRLKQNIHNYTQKNNRASRSRRRQSQRQRVYQASFNRSSSSNSNQKRRVKVLFDAGGSSGRYYICIIASPSTSPQYRPRQRAFSRTRRSSSPRRTHTHYRGSNRRDPRDSLSSS